LKFHRGQTVHQIEKYTPSELSPLIPVSIACEIYLKQLPGTWQSYPLSD